MLLTIIKKLEFNRMKERMTQSRLLGVQTQNYDIH